MKLWMLLLGLCFALIDPLPAMGQYTFTDFTGPQGAISDQLNGISGPYLVGLYAGPSEQQEGFFYNGSVTSNIVDPSADGTFTTVPTGLYGNKVVGFYTQDGSSHGFVERNNVYTTVDDPLGTVGTRIYGISGTTMVGAYMTTSSLEGFIDRNGVFSTLDYPGAVSTQLYGVYGNDVVGEFSAAPHTPLQSFLYNGSTFQAISDPLGTGGTFATSIYLGDVVGYYRDSSGQSHGFLFDGSSYQTIDDPSGSNTELSGIDGNTLVGTYSENGRPTGFEVTIPEPAVLPFFLLMLAGGAGWAFLRYRLFNS